eukprot:12213946-Alexandrium_andersonii.AAC.1
MSGKNTYCQRAQPCHPVGLPHLAPSNVGSKFSLDHVHEVSADIARLIRAGPNVQEQMYNSCGNCSE